MRTLTDKSKGLLPNAMNCNLHIVNIIGLIKNLIVQLCFLRSSRQRFYFLSPYLFNQSLTFWKHICFSSIFNVYIFKLKNPQRFISLIFKSPSSIASFIFRVLELLLSYLHLIWVYVWIPENTFNSFIEPNHHFTLVCRN